MTITETSLTIDAHSNMKDIINHLLLLFGPDILAILRTRFDLREDISPDVICILVALCPVASD